jgi:site-specific DNA-adenine methylase
MGSKNKICDQLIKIFPKAENFYDLFGGGFSVTHAMLMWRKEDYKEFHFNEIRPGITTLIQDAICGKYNYENFQPKWVSKDEFDRGQLDPFGKIVWSFGNECKWYLYSKQIEPYKKALHYAIVFNQFDEIAKITLGLEKFDEKFSITERRLFLSNRASLLERTGLSKPLYKFLSAKQVSDGNYRNLMRLTHLENIERIQNLNQLAKPYILQCLKFHSVSFEEVPIKLNSIIYCDIPYQGTTDYDGNKNFDRKKFLDWAHDQQNPVFISEYQIKDPRFKLIFQTKKFCSFHSDKLYSCQRIEKVFVNQAGFKKLMEEKTCKQN